MRHNTAASWLSSGISICRYKTQLHIFLNHLNQCIKLITHQHRSYILAAAALGSFSFAEFLHSARFSPQTEMLLPLIRTHCHLKATAGIIGRSFTFLMSALEHMSMSSVLMLMLTVQPLRSIQEGIFTYRLLTTCYFIEKELISYLISCMMNICIVATCYYRVERKGVGKGGGVMEECPVVRSKSKKWCLVFPAPFF